jgi:hypothetical protein
LIVSPPPMTVEIPSRYPPLTRPATASRSLPGGSLLVSALAQYSMSADTLGISAAAGTPLPVNSVRENGIFMKRQLDCAVIQMVHKIRESKSMEAYDTVYGVFEEGELVYPGAGFRDKTHVQIAIRNPEMILGYFRVDGMT